MFRDEDSTRDRYDQATRKTFKAQKSEGAVQVETKQWPKEEEHESCPNAATITKESRQES